VAKDGGDWLRNAVAINNPDLTGAQIAELRKALPKCKIGD